MEIFTKFVDFLLERHWKTFFISILCGVVALYVIPKDFYNNLPFSNRDINIALCLFAVIIVVYLLLTLIIFITKKICNIRANQANNAEKAAAELKYELERIEKIKSGIDTWSDHQYSVVMYLINNKNKKPYIAFVPKYCRSYLFNESMLANIK